MINIIFIPSYPLEYSQSLKYFFGLQYNGLIDTMAKIPTKKTIIYHSHCTLCRRPWHFCKTFQWTLSYYTYQSVENCIREYIQMKKKMNKNTYTA